MLKTLFYFPSLNIHVIYLLYLKNDIGLVLTSYKMKTVINSNHQDSTANSQWDSSAIRTHMTPFKTSALWHNLSGSNMPHCISWFITQTECSECSSTFPFYGQTRSLVFTRSLCLLTLAARMDIIATAILCMFWSSWLHSHCITNLAASNLKSTNTPVMFLMTLKTFWFVLFLFTHIHKHTSIPY